MRITYNEYLDKYQDLPKGEWRVFDLHETFGGDIVATDLVVGVVMGDQRRFGIGDKVILRCDIRNTYDLVICHQEIRSSVYYKVFLADEYIEEDND